MIVNEAIKEAILKMVYLSLLNNIKPLIGNLYSLKLIPARNVVPARL